MLLVRVAERKKTTNIHIDQDNGSSFRCEFLGVGGFKRSSLTRPQAIWRWQLPFGSLEVARCQR